ncbi:Hsp20/alpha crystallin family protein [Fontivita pretiosa]|jgi:HSP20 family protein|uniref:Hsp20/alpha crystallin family protein n=1 Tax=Fontivita pretiosa TaxID=2989684 RepID=UPI003D18235D
MSEIAIRKRQNVASVPERIEQATYFTPLVDIIETPDEFIFQADLPGVKAGDVDITYENGVLTIQGKVNPRQPADQIYVWQEYDVGHFYRQFTLNTPINADAIRAELKNGVLELHVPKAESARTRKIQVKSS